MAYAALVSKKYLLSIGIIVEVCIIWAIKVSLLARVWTWLY